MPPPKVMARPAAAVSLPAVGAGAVAAEIANEIASLQSNVSSLQSRASLADVQAEVARLDQQLSDLSQRLEAVRQKGYVYGGDIDTRLYELLSQWQSVKSQIENGIRQHSQVLMQNAMSLHSPLAQLSAQAANAAQARVLLPSVSASVNAVLRQAGEAEHGLRNMYSGLRSDAEALDGRLDRIEQVLKWFAEAKFSLANGESALAAVKAKLDRDGKDDPEGYLFLTDKRLIFEHRQEIVKKKVLFIATEKELVQEVLMDAALPKLAEVKASSKGLFGHEDHLDVSADGKSFHFHLDGQDSNEWAALIERAKGGGLEGERAQAGAGISLADLSGPITQAGLLALQASVNELQQRATLGFARDALEDMETKVGQLPRELTELRARGYLFEKALEGQVQSLLEQWARVKGSVEADMRQQSGQLGQTMPGIQAQMAQVMAHSANPQMARPQVLQVKSMVASAEAQVAAAEQSVFGQYDNFQAEVETLGAHLDWVRWMLDAVSTACFQLLATEGGVQAAQANWLRPNSPPLGGVLFLTDQRVIFEEREGDFSLALEAPVSLVASANGTSEQGPNHDEEHLEVTFAAGAPTNTALFQLAGPRAADWQAFVGRARAGDYATDRATALDPAELERLKNAPTQCPSCGSAYGKPVLRGQTEIRCGYCGTVTRI